MKAVGLLSVRYYLYRQRRWHYYLLEFCASLQLEIERWQAQHCNSKIIAYFTSR